jgi:cytochrome c-type biogenesis protein CcmH
MKQKKILPKSILFILGIILLASYSLLPALAQEESDFDRINDIAKELNCPTCTGINLSDCRTLTCEQWREQIDELVDEGYSDQEVLDYFSTRYGDQVLQEPPQRGFTLLVWILPVVALIGGGTWLVITLRKWRRDPEPVAVSATPDAPTTPKTDDDYLSQVEQDLGIDEE